MGILGEKIRLISVKEDQGRESGLNEAGALLLSGGLIAFPTESFYGLAVDAMNEAAITRLWQAKRRNPDNPILILVPDMTEMDRVAARISPLAQRLMALGLLEGTIIRVTRRALGGDPIEIEVMGSALSLRRDEARRVSVGSASG